MLKKVTAEEAKEILSNTNGVTVIKFGADWCAPCQTYDPILDSMDTTVLKVDVDAEPRYAQEFGVLTLPTTIFFKNGQPENRHMGIATADQVNEYIQKVGEA